MVGHQPTESKGTARSDLICDGLWLSSSFVCEQAGKPTPGVWLLGYDPYKKAYKGICVGSEDPSPSTMDARYDEKTKTWEFTGSGPMGAFKSTATIKDQDNIVETVTCTEGTKVTKVEITHKRAKSAVAAMDAGATVAKAPTKEHEELLKTVGEWDAVMKMSPEPGAPAMELPGTERVVPIRNGRYVWSDFKMQWQGKPFEGHALCGYDTAQKKYVTYWFESTSPTVAESSGICDSHKKAMTMTGTSRDMNGKPVTTREVTTWKDDNTRLMQMESKGEKTESFEITFKVTTARTAGAAADVRAARADHAASVRLRSRHVLRRQPEMHDREPPRRRQRSPPRSQTKSRPRILPSFSPSMRACSLPSSASQ